MNAPIWIPQSLALVDMGCVWKKNFMAVGGGNDPRAAADKTLAELASIRQSVEHVILCLDTPPYTRRVAIYPEYKAQRSPMTEVEREQKKRLLAECKRLGYQMARVEGEEADDVIATLAKIYGGVIPDVRLVGSDKDLAQCVTENVRQMVPPVGERPGELRGPARVLEKYGVTPEQIPMYLALVGDKSDNVPGVPGIGHGKAVALISEHKTFFDLGEAAALRPASGVWKLLKEGWASFEMSLALVKLKTNLEIDYNALLLPLDPEPAPEMAPGFDDAPSMTEGDRQTAEALLEDIRELAPELRPRIGKDPNADEFLRQAHAERERQREALNQAEEEREEKWRREMREENEAAERAYSTRAPENAPANDEQFTEGELEYARKSLVYRAPETLDERGKRLLKAAFPEPPKVTEAEFDPITQSPGVPRPPMPPKPSNVGPVGPGAKQAGEQREALAKAPRDYGLVTEDLQPQDLKAAEVVSKWLHASGLYPQFHGAPAIFAVIMRGKELGLGVTTALAGFHVVEGKPVASADLIRALASRSKKCKYFRLVHSDDTYAEWETLHVDHIDGEGKPMPTRYRYTIEEAIEAGLTSGNWKKRKRDMLTKTAASKLARIVYPDEVLGLYAPEEFNDAYGEAA
ncbi:MAG TPA: 5'-3' exonuclease H3TH domain-containing protein [Microcella sp.]|nr:5'-3' exonuclease H3TH domain-containing protein [Microcella sp.]